MKESLKERERERETGANSYPVLAKGRVGHIPVQSKRVTVCNPNKMGNKQEGYSDFVIVFGGGDREWKTTQKDNQREKREKIFLPG